MNVKTFRLSGNPVDPELSDKKDAEWKESYDRIIEEHGKASPETTAALDALDAELLEKYNDLTVIDTELPTTSEEWVNVLSRYGNIIVTTATETNDHAKSGDLLFVVNDMIF